MFKSLSAYGMDHEPQTVNLNKWQLDKDDAVEQFSNSLFLGEYGHRL